MEYNNLIRPYNIGKSSQELNTWLVPNLPVYGADGQGSTYITYQFLRSGQEVEDLGYYGNNSGEENTFTSNYIQSIENATFDILNDQSPWSNSNDQLSFF